MFLKGALAGRFRSWPPSRMQEFPKDSIFGFQTSRPEPAWPGSDEQLAEKTSRPGFRSLARLTMTGVRQWS